jgi:hypothetical protein
MGEKICKQKKKKKTLFANSKNGREKERKRNTEEEKNNSQQNLYFKFFKQILFSFLSRVESEILLKGKKKKRSKIGRGEKKKLGIKRRRRTKNC